MVAAQVVTRKASDREVPSSNLDSELGFKAIKSSTTSFFFFNAKVRLGLFFSMSDVPHEYALPVTIPT